RKSRFTGLAPWGIPGGAACADARSTGLMRPVTGVTSDELTTEMRVRDPQGNLATVRSVFATGAPSMCRVVLTDGDGYRRDVVCNRAQRWEVVSLGDRASSTDR